jgi:hypothetical protein
VTAHASDGRGTLGAAVRVDIRLLRIQLRMLGAIVFGFVVISFGGFRGGFLLILLATVMPAYLARGGHGSADELRASLGISRADAVRARTRIVCTAQIVLILLMTMIALFGHVDGSSILATLTGGIVLVNGPSVVVWADILTWAPAIVVAHAVVGRAAMREADRVREFLGLGVYIGTYVGLVVLAVLISAPLGAFDTVAVRSVGDLVESTPTFMTVRIAIGGLALVGSVVALAVRYRTWIREA